MSSYIKSDLIFQPPLNEFFAAREDKPLTVFAGANNTGKSLVLKWLKHQIGRTAYMIGTNRFYHVYHFSSGLRDPNEIDQFENQFNNGFYQEQYNWLLMTILGICIDDRFSTVLIDEPELGLGPKIQQSFASFLEDTTERQKYFPHLNRVFLATHSHLFLNRSDPQSNFIISKKDKDITLTQVSSIGDFHRLQFNLLGNSLETMFFPSAIVVVEDKADSEYIERVLQTRFPGRRITIIGAGGDVKRKVAALREAFGDLSKSPFRNRLFVVLDSVHQLGLSSELERMGVLTQNIVTWSRNGIEYLYPVSLLAHIYACSVDRVQELTIRDDRVTLNGISKSKNELKDEILRSFHSGNALPDELESKLLNEVGTAID